MRYLWIGDVLAVGILQLQKSVYFFELFLEAVGAHLIEKLHGEFHDIGWHFANENGIVEQAFNLLYLFHRVALQLHEYSYGSE